MFLTGHLIKNLLVAAGLLSRPIIGPPCQNLCHWRSHPIPRTNTSPVSHKTSVSRGSVMECYSPTAYLSRCSLLAAIHFAAMPVLWLSDLSQADTEVEEVESKSKGQVTGNLGSCFPSLSAVYTSNWMIILASKCLHCHLHLPVLLTELIHLLHV